MFDTYIRLYIKKRRIVHMQKEMKREYPIPFHNDVFFKYMLIGEDAGSKLLRSRIIEEIYGLKVQRTQVLNPELLPEVFFGKRAVLDVVLEDETGHLYDLEMQVSGYTKEEQLRFQQYGYRLVGRQLKQGDDYTKLKPFYQIIFMNSMPKAGGRMIRHYTVKDEDNQEEPNNTLHRAIVFLPMIRQRVKEVGGMENLTEFETFCYVLAYNPDDAILNMKRRMVNVAMGKYNAMREDGPLFSWAESVEFANRAVQANLREQTAEAKRQGKDEGLDQGKKALLRAQIIHKYGIDDGWVDTLSNAQIDAAVICILECEAYPDLKEKLKHTAAE